jgi:hypothetical protein
MRQGPVVFGDYRLAAGTPIRVEPFRRDGGKWRSGSCFGPPLGDALLTLAPHRGLDVGPYHRAASFGFVHADVSAMAAASLLA